VDDLGKACVFALERWSPAPGELTYLNVGTSVDLSIRLASTVALFREELVRQLVRL
jgi:GDP-L-fucose synthase